MKIVLTIGTFIGIFLLSCKVQQPAYEFPPAMTEVVRTEFIKRCDKGKVLYDINCAACHTKKQGKRDIVPDFTGAQLTNYELRILNPKHESKMPETKVTAEELGYITTFLSYKRKNNN